MAKVHIDVHDVTKVEASGIGKNTDVPGGLFFARTLHITTKGGHHEVTIYADTAEALTMPGEPKPDEWGPSRGDPRQDYGGEG